MPKDVLGAEVMIVVGPAVLAHSYSTLTAAQFDPMDDWLAMSLHLS